MFFVPQEEVQTSENNLQERFLTAKTISETQALHRVIPINNSLLKVSTLLQSLETMTVAVCSLDSSADIDVLETNDRLIVADISPGSTFVACVYEHQW